MKNMLLINSPIFDTKYNTKKEDLLPPLGLGIIYSSLINDGIQCELVDAILENMTPDNLINIIDESKHSFVGINIFTTNYHIVKKIVEGVSRKVDFVIGGISTRTLYEHIFSWGTNNNIYVVYGDGELILKDILNGSIKEQPNKYKKSRMFFKVGRDSQYFNKDISAIAPNRDCFDGEPSVNVHGLLEANIITSRGCIYNCAYCSAAQSLNKTLSVRLQSNASVVAEIKSLVSIYDNLKSIRILDDLFLRDKQTIDNAINIFSEFHLKWRAMAHIKTFKMCDIPDLHNLINSGLYELSIGIESGSEKILNLINKKNSVNDIKTTVQMLLCAGINVKGYFIFGFLDETEDDFKKTYELALFLKEESLKYNVCFRPSVFKFRPYHGTIMYKRILDSNHDVLEVLENISPDDELNNSIGREQFNFKSGNYSSEGDDILTQYISMTNNLN